MANFTVAISKNYFPRALWPNSPSGVQEFYETVEIQAATRTEAARKTWAKHSERWLGLVKPSETMAPQRISLHVGTQTTPPGRLDPILVFEKPQRPT